MAQPTGIINEARLLAGAGEFYVGTNPNSLVRIGAYRDALIESKRESTKLTFDNDELNKFKRGDEFSFKFKLGEIDPDTIASNNAGWITATTTPGTPVTGAVQVIANTAYLTLNEIENQNATLALLTVTSVVGSVDGALVANTDYVLVIGPGGKTNIYLINSVTVTTATQNLTVTYNYTPAESVAYTFTKTGIADTFYAKFIHERADGKQVIINLEDVQNILGLTIDFVGNSEDDVATCDIELNGKISLD